MMGRGGEFISKMLANMSCGACSGVRSVSLPTLDPGA
jgi:hypothetical protein